MITKSKKTKLGFHIILLGQITAGKETQARTLMEQFALKPVESGKYWRKMLKSKTPDGDWLRRTTGKGWAAPVPLMKKFLVTNLEAKPKNKDLIFIGNPRLKPEAQLLDKLLKTRKEKYMVMYIKLSDKEIYKRSAKRNTEEGTHAVYKLFDADKKLIRNRIKWHKDQVSLAVKYFKSKNKLTMINGEQSIEKVGMDISKAIQKYQASLQK